MSLRSRLRRLEEAAGDAPVEYIPVALFLSNGLVDVLGETMTHAEYEARYRERIEATRTAGTDQRIFAIKIVSQPRDRHLPHESKTFSEASPNTVSM